MFKNIFSNQDNYFNWRLEKVNRLAKRFPIIFNVKNKKCLDIGCGAEAPLSFYLSRKGGAVYCGDINKQIISSAKKFVKNAKFFIFGAEKLPFKDQEFDFVFMIDVLEHVKNPDKAINEAIRVTKKNGFILIEFSPYYAYPTGPHLYTLGFPRGFIPFQFLPNWISKKIILNSQSKTKDTPEFLYNQFYNLNRVSLSKFKDIIRKKKIKVIDERHCISLPNSEIELNSLKYLPGIKEVATMSYTSLIKNK